MEEHTDTSIEEARIRYHADNVTVRVPIYEAAREDVHRAIERARELRQSVERPPVTDNAHLCLRCSLAPVCLPEEERLARDPDWNRSVCFPTRARDDSRDSSRRTRETAGDTLTIVGTDKSKETFPIREVGEVVVHGNAQITTEAIHLCARKRWECIG